MPDRPARIGIFGGTFDPPHIGHLVVASECRAALGLDQSILMVAGEPWQKVGEQMVSPAPTRLRLTEAATAPYPGLRTSAIEVERPGASYTADTLATLADQHPNADLFVILGADAARNVLTWERLDEVIAGSTLVVCARDGAFGDLPDEIAWHRVTVPRIDISSSEVRARVGAGRSIDVLVPPGVVEIIMDSGLYRDHR